MVEAPRRITLSRKKGWRKPANTINVARPGKWGNPFSVGGWFMAGDPKSWLQAANKAVAEMTPGKFVLVETQTQAVERFAQLMIASPWDVSDLRGKNLACWCQQGTPCHGDLLLRMANKEQSPE